MKHIITLMLTFVLITATAQEEAEYKNALDITMFKLETNSQTLFRKLRPKVYTGFTYERIFGRWSWMVNLEHASTKIKEDCNTCADHFYGTGYLREYNIFTGLNYRLVGTRLSKFQMFIGTDMYYSNLNYSGEFEGGYIGAGMTLNNAFNSFGIRQKIGLHYYLIPRVRATLTTTARLGYSWKKAKGESSSQRIVERSNTFPELRIGFLF